MDCFNPTSACAPAGFCSSSPIPIDSNGVNRVNGYYYYSTTERASEEFQPAKSANQAGDVSSTDNINAATSSGCSSIIAIANADYTENTSPEELLIPDNFEVKNYHKKKLKPRRASCGLTSHKHTGIKSAAAPTIALVLNPLESVSKTHRPLTVLDTNRPAPVASFLRSRTLRADTGTNARLGHGIVNATPPPQVIRVPNLAFRPSAMSSFPSWSYKSPSHGSIRFEDNISLSLFKNLQLSNTAENGVTETNSQIKKGKMK